MSLIDRALEWMPYAEVVSMPPRALVARLAALERHHARLLHDNAVMQAMVGDNNWGQAYEGKAPESDGKYKLTSRPLIEWLEDQMRRAAGLPPLKRKQLEKKQKRKGLLAHLGLVKE